MIFEFVIVYQQEEETLIHNVLTERICSVLSDNMNDFDDDTVEQMVRINYERRPPLSNGEVPPTVQRTVLGFTLELPDETESARTVIDDFTDALRAEPIEHIVKFEDPLLNHELARYAEELFSLEMKLRRVLSVIYLNAYQEDNFYDLLREESVKPMTKEPPKPEQMQKATENQFFHLTFSNYINLNHRPDMKKVPLLVDLIRTKETYEALRAELERLPVENEEDAVFLSSLKERMDAIEAMRNCVAHNRHPSEKIRGNYINARPQVEQGLDDLLNRWSLSWQDEMEGEMPWDSAARQEVEKLIQNAEWDDEKKTITLLNDDDSRIHQTVFTSKELEDILQAAASSAFYANAPRDSGEFVFECDEYGVVEGVLSEYEDQLDSFFADAEENEANFL